MRRDPGHGETPVAPDDLDALAERAREFVGDAPTKAYLYDLEQAISNEVADAHIEQVIDGTLGFDDLFADHFLRDLHGRLYGDIWTWAGRFRTKEFLCDMSCAPDVVECGHVMVDRCRGRVRGLSAPSLCTCSKSNVRRRRIGVRYVTRRCVGGSTSERRRGV